MESNRQKSENWLNPATQARITCHNIKWIDSQEFESIQAGGDLYFCSIPCSGTMLHSHDFMQILFVNDGSLTHLVNGERQRLAIGELCFLRPDDVHGLAPDGDVAQAEIVMLDFDLDLALSISEFFGDDGFLRRMTEPVLPACFRLDPSESAALYNRLLSFNMPKHTAQVLKIKLKVLLADLYTRFFIDEFGILGESCVPAWLESLCTAMRRKENFCAGLPRMQELSRRTPGHLCKVFAKHLQKTPTEFINELRINHAALQLADTGRDILDIADELNFQSLSHFYSLFRSAYGTSPAAYRRMHASGRRI
ncbi:MAG: AraC family transcriptional regulator [Kiritimatiellia bacterium]|jgi:AraC family cel operon transcriptional repressor